MATIDDPGDGTVAIRVALAEVPSALRDSLELEVRHQADMRLVQVDAGSLTERMDLLLVVARGADVLVLGTRDAPVTSPPGICDHLLSQFPELIIALVSQTGDAATLYWLGARRYRLRRVSANGLLRVTRRALAARTSLQTLTKRASDA